MDVPVTISPVPGFQAQAPMTSFLTWLLGALSQDVSLQTMLSPQDCFFFCKTGSHVVLCCPQIYYVAEDDLQFLILQSPTAKI